MTVSLRSIAQDGLDVYLGYFQLNTANIVYFHVTIVQDKGPARVGSRDPGALMAPSVSVLRVLNPLCSPLLQQGGY